MVYYTWIQSMCHSLYNIPRMGIFLLQYRFYLFSVLYFTAPGLSLLTFRPTTIYSGVLSLFLALFWPSFSSAGTHGGGGCFGRQEFPPEKIFHSLRRLIHLKFVFIKKLHLLIAEAMHILRILHTCSMHTFFTGNMIQFFIRRD